MKFEACLHGTRDHEKCPPPRARSSPTLSINPVPEVFVYFPQEGQAPEKEHHENKDKSKHTNKFQDVIHLPEENDLFDFF